MVKVWAAGGCGRLCKAFPLSLPCVRWLRRRRDSGRWTDGWELDVVSVWRGVRVLRSLLKRCSAIVLQGVRAV